VHGLAHPVCHPAGGDAESDVIEPLDKLGTDVVRAVVVANDGDDGHPIEGHHATPRVSLTEERVQPLEDSLGLLDG